MDYSTLPPVLTARDIAKFMGIGYQKSLSLIKYGNIPHIKLGSTYRVSKEKFIIFLNADTVQEFNFNNQ